MRWILTFFAFVALTSTAQAQPTCVKGKRGSDTWFETFFVRPDGGMETCETKKSWGHSICRVPPKLDPSCQWWKADRCKKQGKNAWWCKNEPS